jgi:hypothetical protein
VNEKTCTKCKGIFPATTEYFYKRAACKSGLVYECKGCSKQRSKRHYENNKEHRKEYNKEWRENNKERKKEYMKEYREKNKERKKEYNKEYNQQNKEPLKEYRRIHNAKISSGIYRIINTENGRPYIGQSSQYPLRWLNHKSCLRQKNHRNAQLQEDYNTYGEEAFIFEVIEELPCDTSQDVLLKKESEQIKKHLREGKNVYNCLN